jgi:hypothetical protein
LACGSINLIFAYLHLHMDCLPVHYLHVFFSSKDINCCM